MLDVKKFAAHGKVTSVRDQMVIFQPRQTNYELHLVSGGSWSGPTGTPVAGIIRATARKMWTVPSGGNFIAPILGTPRTIQGRVRDLDERSMIVQAGTFVLIELPQNGAAIDLNNGPVQVGSLVNVVALPGATFELLPVPAVVE